MKQTLLTFSLVAAGLVALYFGAQFLDLHGLIMRLHGR
jgi:hypothetical protein